MRPHFSKKSAFTLTELLVVIGLIGLLGTALGTALTGGKGRALAAAQREVISSLNVARMAAIKGGSLNPANPDTSGQKSVAALVINVDEDSTGYLREFGVVAGLRSATGFSDYKWRTVGPAMTLPEGIYFVLSERADDMDADSSIVDSGTAVISTTYPYYRTYASGATGNQIGTDDTALRRATRFFFIFFNPDGTITSTSTNGSPNERSDLNIIMAVGEKQIQRNGQFTIEFTEKGQATGVRTVRYGNPIPILDQRDLKYN